jgi:hypothetical protein
MQLSPTRAMERGVFRLKRSSFSGFGSPETRAYRSAPYPKAAHQASRHLPGFSCLGCATSKTFIIPPADTGEIVVITIHVLLHMLELVHRMVVITARSWAQSRINPYARAACAPFQEFRLSPGPASFTRMFLETSTDFGT